MASRLSRRGSGAVAVGVVACALALPATAHAAEGPDPIIAGSCAATFDDDAASVASPLTVDAGAAAEAPGVLTVGLGTESEGTNGHRDPLLAVPASDTLDALGVTSTPVVSDASTGACEAAKPAGNGAGATVQHLVPIDDVTAPGPGAPAGGQPPGDESPDNPTGETPDDETPSDGTPGDPDPGGAVDPIALGPGLSGFGEFGGFGASGGFGAVDVPSVLGGSLDALGTITLPPTVLIDSPVRAPDLNSPAPEGGSPDDQAKASGSAQAIPSGTLDRLPLLLAVVALALVEAALSKTLHGRQTL